MTIGIDARMYGLEHAGIGRYVQNLVEYLPQVDQKNSYVIFVNPKVSRELHLPKRFMKVEVQSRHYSVYEQWEMWQQVRKSDCDLIHFPHFNVPLLSTRPFVVTIHDILWHQQKGAGATTLSPLQYGVKFQGYKRVVRHAVTKAKRVIVPSKWVQKQILREFPELDGRKIKVIYEGVDASFIMNKSTRKPASKTQPFVLYVGSAYPHKNLTRLIRAIALVNQEKKQIDLKIVSSRDVFLDAIEKEIRQLDIQDQVELLGFVDDETLGELLSAAKMLIQPSFSEGFGLTGLEAMKVGTPVAAAAAGAMPEIYDKAAIFFDPTSVEDMAETIRKLITDHKLAEKMSELGKEQANNYSFKSMVKEILTVYESSVGT